MLVRTFNEVSLLIVDCINCCCDDLMTLTNQYEERGLVTLMASSLIALHMLVRVASLYIENFSSWAYLKMPLGYVRIQVYINKRCWTKGNPFTCCISYHHQQQLIQLNPFFFCTILNYKGKYE